VGSFIDLLAQRPTGQIKGAEVQAIPTTKSG
jgi:hypothetical protein